MGKFLHIGHDVLRNHMMVYFNHANGAGADKNYKELVKLLVYHTYFWNLEEEQLCQLDVVISQFYSEYARDFLISQTWILSCPPSREERFARMFRLAEHCKKLGIPNPYSTEEIYEADERWKNYTKMQYLPLSNSRIGEFI